MGNSCFAALCGDRLASYAWYARNSIEAENGGGITLSFPPNMAYVYRAFTHPDFRGRRLNALAMSLALRELARQGVDELIATIDRTNWASLKSFYRLGYTDQGRVVKIRPRHKPIFIGSRGARQLGIRFGREADLSNRC